MNSGVLTVLRSKENLAEPVGVGEDLVRRVAASSTFEKSARLQAFLLYVCRCALENKPEEVTEQQIGINVYGRQPGYNPSEDNIVRSQARLLRLKLEHHFANEGKHERVIITIPKGHYLPIFEARSEDRQASPDAIAADANRARSRHIWLGAGVLFAFGLAWFVYYLFQSRHSIVGSSVAAAGSISHARELLPHSGNHAIAVAPEAGEIRIAAGHTGAPYVDASGHTWGADRYYEGGVVQAGPQHFFPPIAEEEIFRAARAAASVDIMVLQSERQFRYEIPAPPGVYELRLFFGDPLRQSDSDSKEDAQNKRHFQINLNGHPLLVDFDPIADAGSAAVDVRTFKDVRPDESDGKVNLEFLTGWGAPPFVSALELTPGVPGKLKPIRVCAHQSDFVDTEGTRWSGDSYFIGGRTNIYENPDTGPKIPELYTGERHGNFSYAIPVPPGSYTVKLHFLESFFTPLIPAAYCRGVGCRVFDVTCNGVMLLQDFDIVQAAPGTLRPVVREFHGLQPNGQGKLLLSFSPKVNYAEVRAIEVIDEGK